MSTRHLATAAAALLTIAFLAGCSTTDATPADTAPVPTATPTTEQTPTAEPTEAATLPDFDCESVLPPITLKTFTTTKGFDMKDDFVDRMRALGSPLVSFVDDGGILCQWSSKKGALVSYGFSPVTEAQATEQRDLLKTEGFAETTTDRGILVANPDADQITDTYMFTDGYWFYATGADFLQQIVENAYSQ